MFIDTHCHLNFAAFDGKVEDIVDEAKKDGVNQIIVPGTDIPTSEKAIEIAEKHEGVYAAVGIHPHHIFEIYNKTRVSVLSTATPPLEPLAIFEKQKPSLYLKQIKDIEKLMSNPKVVAIGEVGIDRHIYQKTKYPDYKIEEEFVELQKIFLIEQIKLAHKYKKSLILHNREAKKDILEILTNSGLRITDYRSVFHCCEPDLELLNFAKENKMFIGVDGDIAYYKEKQEWIKRVPLEMLVLETDSPYLSPAREFPNVPKNIPIIAEFVAKLKGVSIEQVEKQTTENARRLFKINDK